MYSEILGAVRSEAFNHEFYRNCPRNADLPEFLEHSWRESPSVSSTWQAAALAKFGDLLISAGTRLKYAARPTTAVLSQEML